MPAGFHLDSSPEPSAGIGSAMPSFTRKIRVTQEARIDTNGVPGMPLAPITKSRANRVILDHYNLLERGSQR